MFLGKGGILMHASGIWGNAIDVAAKVLMQRLSNLSNLLTFHGLHKDPLLTATAL
jgi:hypothetical protein